jgi:hypothetical protein
MIYAVVNKENRQGMYGDTNYSKAASVIFRLDSTQRNIGLGSLIRL